METFTRDAKLEMRAETTDKEMIVEAALSSAEPYQRWWGVEVLSHEKAAINLSRLDDGASVLFNHDWNDLRGVVASDSSRIGKDGKLRAKLQFTNSTAKGQETISLIKDRILSKISIGYSIDDIQEVAQSKSGEEVRRSVEPGLFEFAIRSAHATGDTDRAAFYRTLDKRHGEIERKDNEPSTFVVTRWTPHEVSLVTVPADITVGIGRSMEQSQSTTAETAIIRSNQMPEATVTAAPASATAENKISAVEAEKERRQAIINLCKSNKIDARVEARWIEDGTPLTTVAAELLDVMEERGRYKPSSASQLGLTTKETQNYSLFRAIRALRYGAQDPRLQSDAAFEIECSRAVAKQMGRAHSSSMLIPAEVLTRPLGKEAAAHGMGSRAMATTPGSKGGYLVSVDNMGFIDILRNRSVAMAMGARVISGLQGNVTFPRQTGKVTVTWQAGEGTSVTAADQALGQLSMTPKTCIAITDVSEQLLAQSSPSAEAFVMADLAADVAIDGVDAATINGTGGAQPLGIKNTTGVTTGQDAASVTYAKIRAFVSTAGAANAIRGNPGWVTTTAGASVLMGVQRFTSTDTPLWEGNMLDGTVIGFRSMSSEQLASGNLIFGSWDELVIGEWGVLELSTDNGGTRFNTAQVGIRAMWMVDVMLRYPQAFVVSTNLS